MQPLSRAEFIWNSLAAISTASITRWLSSEAPDAMVMTVSGKMPASSMAFTLSHEHVLVDFVGANEVNPARYNVEEAYNTALPHLRSARQSGCTTLIECTPAYLGRDVKLLKKLSVDSGIKIITNTGYYGASQEKYLPPHVYTESADQLAARWIAESENGIEGTDIKPGFIKCGTDKGPLSPAVRKTIAAAAITHKATGLQIGVHTGDGKAATEQLRILKDLDVPPSAWIWIHAQNEADRAYHLEAAKNGGWISFDNYHPKANDAYIRFLSDMKKADLLDRVLISHDAGWYHVGEPGGGSFRPYNDIFDYLLPSLRINGFSENDSNRIFHLNPASAFALKPPANAKRIKKVA